MGRVKQVSGLISSALSGLAVAAILAGILVTPGVAFASVTPAKPVVACICGGGCARRAVGACTTGDCTNVTPNSCQDTNGVACTCGANTDGTACICEGN